MKASELREIGFDRVGSIPVDPGNPIINDGITITFEEEGKDTLYAFVVQDGSEQEVRYIGYTERKARKRWYGYTRKHDVRDLRNVHRQIHDARAAPGEVEIWVFQPGPQDFPTRSGTKFEIDLAASLEVALLRRFRPPWNTRIKSKSIERTPKADEIVDGDRQQRD